MEMLGANTASRAHRAVHSRGSRVWEVCSRVHRRARGGGGGLSACCCGAPSPLLPSHTAACPAAAVRVRLVGKKSTG